MKWFKKHERPVHEHIFGKKPDKGVMVLQGETATATRAVISGVTGMLPNIQFKFKVRHGFDEKGNEEFDEVWIEMTMQEAGKLIDQALSSYQAAMPRMPRIAQRTQYGE
jgi:hypothetical protein